MAGRPNAVVTLANTPKQNPSAMNQNREAQTIIEKVREGYGAIAREGDSCCGTAASCCGGPGASADTLAQHIGYSAEELAALPEGANLGLSCGNPNALAALKPGEVVLDLGSGAGFDVFIAARKVGPTGRAIGVDMTPEMIAKARRNAAGYREKTGLDNVEFRLGEIEHLPVADASVDVVISNCVINLSPDKPRVFREAFRVLKPGGRLQVSDIVWTRPVPEEVRGDMEKWAGCIAGALLESEYLDHIRAAGFVDVASVATEYPGGKGLASAAVTARKPAASDDGCGCGVC